MTYFFQTQFHILVHHILTNLRAFCHTRIALAWQSDFGVCHTLLHPPRSFTPVYSMRNYAVWIKQKDLTRAHKHFSVYLITWDTVEVLNFHSQQKIDDPGKNSATNTRERNRASRPSTIRLSLTEQLKNVINPPARADLFCFVCCRYHSENGPLINVYI